MVNWDKEIQTTKVSSEIAKVIEDRIMMLIAYSMHACQAKDLINNIARNCYVQGVLDGEQLNKSRNESDE